MGDVWQVDGANGENRFVAGGGSQAEAWWVVGSLRDGPGNGRRPRPPWVPAAPPRRGCANFCASVRQNRSNWERSGQARPRVAARYVASVVDDLTVVG
jgi:hypothetical protein